MEWQPIETAPINDEVLVYNPKFGVLIGWINHNLDAQKPRPYWVYDNVNKSKKESRAYPPTHWMPLPEPPETSRQLHETDNSAA